MAGLTWELSGLTLGSLGVSLELSGGSLEAGVAIEWPWGDPRRHPGGTQGTKEARGALEEKCAKSYVFFRQDARDPAFYRRGREVTLTISTACAQKLSMILRRISHTTTALVDRRNPYSRELFGEQMCLLENTNMQNI